MSDNKTVIDIKGLDLGIKSIIIALLVVYILLAHTCGGFNSKIPRPTASEVTRDTVSHTKDTVFSHHTDTVVDTLLITRSNVIRDTIYMDSSDEFKGHKVHTVYEDSLLEAKVSTQLKGSFIGQNLDYTLLSPRKTINNTDTIRITEETTIEKTRTRNSKWRLGLGAELQGSRNSFDLAPEVSIEKDGTELSYSYNVLGGTHRIGLEKKIDLDP